jgi:hypothetical protein
LQRAHRKKDVLGIIDIGFVAQTSPLRWSHGRMREPKGPETCQKATNWASHNAALKALGSRTIWLDKDMQCCAPASGRRGPTQTFTDAAIQFCQSNKCLFGLALRQSLGLIQRLLQF